MTTHHEAELHITIWIGLECTRRSMKPTKEGEYPDPGNGPEFEVDEIRAGEDMSIVMEGDLIEFVGLDEAKRLVEAAKKEAVETGEF